jgi:hypothetical protein
MKLHTINEKKPMKELVDRKGKTAQKKCEKHHPKAISGLGDPFSAWEDNLIIIGDEAIRSGLVQIFCVKTEGTQLVTVFIPLVILCFCARCFTRIYDLRTGDMQEIKGAQRLQQWRQRWKQ